MDDIKSMSVLLLDISFIEVMSVIILFLCVPIAATLMLSLPEKSDSQVKTIAKCIAFIGKENHFFKRTTVIYNFKQEQNLVEETISNLVSDELSQTIPLIITNDLKTVLEYSDIKLLILIFYENCESLIDHDIDFIENNIYLIIIEKSSLNQCIDIITNFSKSVKALDITYIIYESVKEKYILATDIPEYDETSCNISKNIQILENNYCENWLLTKNQSLNVFPSKIPVNYKKCPFKLGLATLFPYSTVTNKESLTNLDPIDEAYGSDVEMLKIFTQNINASLNLYYIFREEENPYLHMEFLDFLLNGTLDACAGGLYRIYGNIIEYSGIYSSQTVDWIYYVERDIRSWQSLTTKINGLYYFLIFYMFYTLVWKLISAFDHQAISIVETLLYGWGALIGASALPDARTVKKKILNLSYLILCLHLSAYISAQMYSYLTIQGPPPIYKNADELRNSDKTPYLRYSTMFFIRDRKYELFANTSKECSEFNNCLQVILKHNGATILLDSYLIPFQARTAINDEARVLRVPESILVVYHEMLIKKDHPLKSKFKFIIEKLFEAGISHKLYNEAIGIVTVHKSGIFNKNIMSESYSCTMGCAITLAQSAGAFYVWLLGSVLSVLVFVIEVISKKITKQLKKN